MRLKLLNDREKCFYETDILHLLSESDKDFVPPLSYRNSTLDKSFSTSHESKSGILNYYEAMKLQEMLAVLDGERFVGFVSFRLDFTNEIISDNDLPNVYISTLILDKKERGKGLTKMMYSHLFFDLYPERTVFTRTWSTNFAHTKILLGFGFSEMERKTDDRGKGIDTVYYVKRPQLDKKYNDGRIKNEAFF